MAKEPEWEEIRAEWNKAIQPLVNWWNASDLQAKYGAYEEYWALVHGLWLGLFPIAYVLMTWPPICSCRPH